MALLSGNVGIGGEISACIKNPPGNGARIFKEGTNSIDFLDSLPGNP